MMGNVVKQVEWKRVIDDIMMGFYFSVMQCVMFKTGLQENPMPPKTLQVLNQIVNFVPLERKRAKDQERAERSVAGRLKRASVIAILSTSIRS